MIIRVLFVLLACDLCYLCYASGVQCSGLCTVIQNCDSAWTLLQRAKIERDNDDFALLQSAFCGYDGYGQVMICCETVQSRMSSKNVQRPDLDLLPKNCGFIDGNRVIGGNVTGLKEFPWMALVSLDTRDGPQFQCGGSVINSRYVLTAGHCVAGKEVLGVRVGEHDLSGDLDCEGTATITCSDPVQDIPVERVIIHQNHSSSNGIWAHDIALLRLNHTIDLTRSNARPICLPVTKAEQQRNLKGISAVIPGWGATEKGPRADVLLKANVPIYSKEDCVEMYEGKSVPAWSRTSTRTFLCAGLRGVDSCRGDSGGPLLVSGRHGGFERYIQYGISSFGEAKCGGGRPSLYTDVVMHMPWILDHMEP